MFVKRLLRREPVFASLDASMVKVRFSTASSSALHISAWTWEGSFAALRFVALEPHMFKS